MCKPTYIVRYIDDHSLAGCLAIVKDAMPPTTKAKRRPFWARRSDYLLKSRRIILAPGSIPGAFFCGAFIESAAAPSRAAEVRFFGSPERFG